MRRAEWLVARPWRPVLLVLLVVLPLLFLGELAAADTLGRVRRDQEHGLRALAQRASETITTRANALSGELTGATSIPRLAAASGYVFRRSAESPAETNTEPDLRELAFQLAAVRAVMRSNVAYLFTVDGAGIVQAVDPPNGQPAAGTDVRNTEYQMALDRRVARYAGADASSSSLAVAVPLGVGRRAVATHSLVAILRPRSIESWLASLTDSVADMYVVDQQGRVLARLNGEATQLSSETRREPAVAAAISGGTYLGDGHDPFTNESALVASTPVKDLDWGVMAVAKRDALQSEVDTALAQQRALRFGLSAVLLLGAAMVGVASSAAIRRRRETTEALEQQTAVSEVLKSISASGFDLSRVLGTVTEHATRLSGATQGIVYRRDGNVLHFAAGFGPSEELMEFNRRNPIAVGNRGTLTGRVAIDKRTIHLADVLQDSEYTYVEAQRLGGFRAMLGVPLMSGDELLGAMSLWRTEPVPFSEGQIAVVETFARQAAVAIQNVRLFNETKEALEQQTAVGEVLKTISRSAFDLQPVLDIVLNNAVRLAGADIGWLSRVENDQFTTVAYSTEFPESVREELVRQRAQGHVAGPWVPLGKGGGLMGFTLAEGRTVHLPDVKVDPELKGSVVARLTASRTVVGVPMLRDGRSIGGMVLARYEVRPFGEREIELVQTFADQAAIAIENVRLFSETKESLEQQTAVSEVLKTISRSAFDLEPTLQVVVQNAARLCDADIAWMTEWIGDGYRYGARYARTDELEARAAGAHGMRKGSRSNVLNPRTLGARVYSERRTINVPDIMADPGLSGSKTALDVGARSIVAVPVLREGEAVGAMLFARLTVRPFTEREIQLVETFADQAAIAIHNVRLFNEIQDKSRELEVAGRHKSEFLANMSHELRTPLNAIIGFSEVLLQGIFGDVNEKQREYLTDVLGSGQHLLSLINDILDLSKIEAGRMELELSTFPVRAALESGMTIVRERAARHGIALSATVSDDVGAIEADERKVKQILYNLLSNAVKFTPDGGRVDVSVRAEDGEVRVEVRDTGIGVAASDQERIFEEFRQVGRERSREGTGLGLTLTKRFVELHGGRIWLESTPGKGSTFGFTLPVRRAAAVSA